MANPHSRNRNSLAPVSKNRSNGSGEGSTTGHGVLSETRVSALRTLGEKLYVLSFPVPQFRYPANVTAAEKKIIQLLLDGLSTTQISRKRGTSQQTVSKQLASIYQKAGVRSRAELVAWMLGRA
jgi:DNA-binding CsgD family transcriptional regulator